MQKQATRNIVFKIFKKLDKREETNGKTPN